MAGGMDLGTPRGKKKTLDASLNLVPFIDLMAVTIVFLIWSAVWTQVGRLEVSQSANGGDLDPEKTEVPIVLALTEKGMRLTVGGSAYEPVPLVRDGQGRIDVSALEVQLKAVKAQQPQQVSLTLTPDDGVPYEDVVRLVDTCTGSDFPSVSISPAS